MNRKPTQRSDDDKEFNFALLDFNAEALVACVTELKTVFPDAGECDLECIYISNGLPDERQVFKLTSDKYTFALKLDTQSHKTGRLALEFNRLQVLHRHFKLIQKCDVIMPVYLSRDKTFMLTTFVDAPTAQQKLTRTTNVQKASQTFRRMGAWTHHLHAIEPHTAAQFWPGWMLKKITDPTYRQNTKAPWQLCKSAIQSLQRDAQVLRGLDDLMVFSHGDLHGNNILIGNEITYGLDCTESKSKLAVYDIVDILTTDILVSSDRKKIGTMGIIEENYKAFFETYKFPISFEILDFCIKSRLLISWLKISRTDYERSEPQRKRFYELQKRIQAFSS